MNNSNTENSPLSAESRPVPPEAMDAFKEVLLHTGEMGWIDKSLEGLSHKMLWRDDDTGASIAIVRFQQGSGIPNAHVHSSNQFMYCLQGTYRYIPTGTTLRPGDFYWNPKGSAHGPTVADEESILLEVYDGPHYPERPPWYDNDEDAR